MSGKCPTNILRPEFRFFDHRTSIPVGLIWRQRQQTRAAVRSSIEVVLNTLPEEPYPEKMWHEKVEATWQFVLSRYGTAANIGAS